MKNLRLRDYPQVCSSPSPLSSCVACAWLRAFVGRPFAHISCNKSPNGRRTVKDARNEAEGLKERRKKEQRFGRTARGKPTNNELYFIIPRSGRPICRKVLNIMFWKVPLADWLIL